MKSLFLYTQARHGRAAADALLAQTRLSRDDLNDETGVLPILVWHTALVAFVSRWGRAELAQTLPYVVADQNLGVWTGILRNAMSPADSLERLNHRDGGERLAERWDTLSLTAGHWCGQLRLDGDARHEADGLCSAAREIELAAIPLLFGLPAGVARQSTSSASSDQANGSVQRFDVFWKNSPPIWWSLISAILSGSVVVGGGLMLGSPLPAVFAAALVGITTALAHLRIRAYRLQSQRQSIRLKALERAATLREARDREAVAFREGSVLAGQYRLRLCLGSGASGAIWEAERLTDGEEVAVKLLRAAVAHDTVAADRLRREAQALGLAWHPNVVEIFDEGHLPDGTSYLVMERLHGESLADRLRRTGRIQPTELLSIAFQVCDALGAVHAAGVVHRDLKPSNIFLQSTAHRPADAPTRASSPDVLEGSVVKVLDFGVARVEWAETRLTNVDRPLGTPGYMAPEQELGDEIDSRVDVFALGAVIHECLTGTPPPDRLRYLLEGSGPVDLESGVQRAPSGVPDAWWEVIKQATAPIRHQRFPDVRTMREALAAIADLQRRSSAS